MKKIVLIALMSLAVSACSKAEPIDKKSVREMTESMSIVCIDSVQYWMGDWGTASVMSPRISLETGGYVRCPKVQTTTENIPVTQKISE